MLNLSTLKVRCRDIVTCVELDTVARLLQVERKLLCTALTERKMEVKGQTLKIPLKLDQVHWWDPLMNKSLLSNVFDFCTWRNLWWTRFCDQRMFNIVSPTFVGTRVTWCTCQGSILQVIFVVGLQDKCYFGENFIRTFDWNLGHLWICMKFSHYFLIFDRKTSKRIVSNNFASILPTRSFTNTSSVIYSS